MRSIPRELVIPFEECLGSKMVPACNHAYYPYNAGCVVGVVQHEWMYKRPQPVILAKAGVQRNSHPPWIPAFAGMT